MERGECQWIRLRGGVCLVARCARRHLEAPPPSPTLQALARLHPHLSRCWVLKQPYVHCFSTLGATHQTIYQVIDLMSPRERGPEIHDNPA